MITPVLVKPESMEGTGFLGAHASEVYRLEADDLYLVGTSEVPLAAYHGNEILDLPAGAPRRYAGWSSCFRREAGSYGKDTRGIIRVHQFDKVEMFSYCRPEEAARRAPAAARLGRGDAGQGRGALPGHRRRRRRPRQFGARASTTARRGCPSQGRYREVTSTSNCTTFQARRLGVRYRDDDGKPQVAATLNGTLATTRWIVAILENHQQPDGSVAVPKALQPFLGGRDVLDTGHPLIFDRCLLVRVVAFAPAAYCCWPAPVRRAARRSS